MGVGCLKGFQDCVMLSERRQKQKSASAFSAFVEQVLLRLTMCVLTREGRFLPEAFLNVFFFGLQ